MNIVWLGIILVTNFFYAMNSSTIMKPSTRLTKKELGRIKWLEEQKAEVDKSNKSLAWRSVDKGELTEGERDIYVETYKAHVTENRARKQFDELDYLLIKNNTAFKIIRLEIDKKMYGSIPAILNPKEDRSCSVVIFDMSFDTELEIHDSVVEKFPNIIWALCPDYPTVKCYIATLALYQRFITNKLAFAIEDQFAEKIKNNFAKFFVAPVNNYSIYSKTFEKFNQKQNKN